MSLFEPLTRLLFDFVGPFVLLFVLLSSLRPFAFLLRRQLSSQPCFFLRAKVVRSFVRSFVKVVLAYVVGVGVFVRMYVTRSSSKEPFQRSLESTASEDGSF